MKKKWLIAVFVSKNEGILKIWSGKVSWEVTDVSTPENTVFYFFHLRRLSWNLHSLNLQKKIQ